MAELPEAFQGHGQLFGVCLKVFMPALDIIVLETAPWAGYCCKAGFSLRRM